MPACCVLRVSSYQELLALEEHIGVVSTGLSEEAISKCVKLRKYAPSPSCVNPIPEDIEIKCSICQVSHATTCVCSNILQVYLNISKLNVIDLYRKILKNLKSWVCWSVGIIIMLLALSNGLMRRINALFASHQHVNLKV